MRIVQMEKMKRAVMDAAIIKKLFTAVGIASVYPARCAVMVMLIALMALMKKNAHAKNVLANRIQCTNAPLLRNVFRMKWCAIHEQGVLHRLPVINYSVPIVLVLANKRTLSSLHLHFKATFITYQVSKTF